MKTKKERKKGKLREHIELSLIPLSRPQMTEKTYSMVEGVLRGGWWTTGPWTKALEGAFQGYTGAPHAVALSSCSAALHLAVKAMRHQTRDLVAVSPMTFCSTVNAIIHNGLIPYFIDIDRRTGNMDPFLLEEAVRRNPLIRGVVVVHFAGYPCDMGSILRIVKDYGLFLVEDCAHAVETLWEGRHAGTLGDVGCFSFNPTKNVAAPEMGMLITRHERVAEMVREKRLHGMSTSTEERVERPGIYDVCSLGYKYNPTDVEAVVALNQLEVVEENYKVRQTIWKRYCNAGVDKWRDLDMCPSRHGLHLFQIFIGDRNAFIKRMRKEFKVTCGIHYTPVHKFSYMREYSERVWSLPNAEWWGEHVVSLPFGPGLREEEVDRVIVATNKCFGGRDE